MPLPKSKRHNDFYRLREKFEQCEFERGKRRRDGWKKMKGKTVSRTSSNRFHHNKFSDEQSRTNGNVSFADPIDTNKMHSLFLSFIPFSIWFIIMNWFRKIHPGSNSRFSLKMDMDKQQKNYRPKSEPMTVNYDLLLFIFNLCTEFIRMENVCSPQPFTESIVSKWIFF